MVGPRGIQKPLLISTALSGQADTQVPHPRHIFMEMSMGESRSSSCSNNLLWQDFTAGQLPNFSLQSAGRQRSKSIFAYFSIIFSLILIDYKSYIQTLPI